MLQEHPPTLPVGHAGLPLRAGIPAPTPEARHVCAFPKHDMSCFFFSFDQAGIKYGNHTASNET